MKILIVQRFYYNFREGFFNHLYEQEKDFKLINHIKSKGRVIVHNKTKSYFLKTKSFTFGQNIVFFPFLFFQLIKNKPRVIVTEGGQNTINNIQIYLYSKIFKCPYIQWDLGRKYMVVKENLFRNLYMKIYTVIAKNAEYIYGYNSESEKYFISLGVKKEKIIVLNNTIDTSQIKKLLELKEDKICAELNNLPLNKIYIIFVGSLLSTKNIESLKNILNLLGDEYHLLIIGSGSQKYEENLRNYFSGTNHTFFGYKIQKELLPFYEKASFSILPGLGGLAINQSMAFGVPVLCTKADGAELDLIENNVNGYIYDDINILSKYILSKSKSDWKEMGNKAQQDIFEKFTIEESIEKFLKGINSTQNA